MIYIFFRHNPGKWWTWITGNGRDHLTLSRYDGTIKRKGEYGGCGIFRIYKQSKISSTEASALKLAGFDPSRIHANECYYAEWLGELSDKQMKLLEWLLAGVGGAASMDKVGPQLKSAIEIGPRLSFATPWSTTATEICRRVGLTEVTRLERSRVYEFLDGLDEHQRSHAGTALHDRMTQMIYLQPLKSFESGALAEPVTSIPLMSGGIGVLKEVGPKLGLAMDEEDMAHCLHIFVNVLKRDPTDVELFQIGLANSEHCRHHFFRAKVVIDGIEQQMSLMDLIKAPYEANRANSAIAFHDDSSAIEGARALLLVAEDPKAPSALRGVAWRVLYTMTAETHNFPTGVAPFPGAATGTGGRIRDNQSVGRGGRTSASMVGYATADWHLPKANLPWEDNNRELASGLAAPLEIMLGAMRGAWGYGNCFGEPVIGGWVRTLDLVVDDVRYAYLRPILYSAGVGFMREEHKSKEPAAPGMMVVQIGGPAYSIGLGGGAAASREGGTDTQTLDFDAVQRGDPAMAEPVGRVIDACIALGEASPIRSAHDLGAGGDANALPEIVDPAGAKIELRAIPSGDSSLSVMTLWGNESQERIAILVRPRDLGALSQICDREGAPMAVVGEVTGNGRLVVFDSKDGTTPVDLPLDEVLGDVPLKTIRMESHKRNLRPLEFPAGLSAMEALDRVLRLPAVASKWAVILGVDRSVTGLIAQQQCVGPDHVPLSNYSVVADGYYGHTGRAHAIGERPLIGLVSAAAQGRMTVGEAITNLMGAVVESLPRVRASVNVMAAARQNGEGAEMYYAYQALSDLMIQLGVAADGGKDSLSMAVPTNEGLVRGARQLVVAAYAAMPDVRCKVTPDFKQSDGELVLVDLAPGHARLGGSALAQVYGQVGDVCPDVGDAGLLTKAFQSVQQLIREGAVRALHDRSDGGLITTVAEMAFAGSRGCEVTLPDGDEMATLFNEELGVVLECANPSRVKKILLANDVPHSVIGRVGPLNGELVIRVGTRVIVREEVLQLRAIWEATGVALDRHQVAPALVADEAASRSLKRRHSWNLSFVPTLTPKKVLLAAAKPRVAILREVGTNGDRELAAAFEMAGFEAWDVTCSDLADGRISLERFRGLAMAGGFSFGDVLGAGIGWAAGILYNPSLSAQFQAFRDRVDTFSFGVCNGAQLSTTLGLVGPNNVIENERLRLVANESQRFESRFVHVAIDKSPAIMLDGMAGSRLGIWAAHGEGRLLAPNKHVLDEAIHHDLAPIRYVGVDNSPTTDYPANPNGSPMGIAGLCSTDGRHLAMMPHPERLAHQLWQWPYLPEDMQGLAASPWLRMFQNAYTWCVNHSSADQPKLPRQGAILKI